MEGSPTRPRFERSDEPTDETLGRLVTQVSENASTLIREEIELAKAEVEQKLRRLAMGAVVSAVAGFFVLIGLIFIFQTIAWAITDVFFPNDIWAGFLITTLLLFLLAGLGGLIAYKAFQAGAPPVPDQAIEEAKLMREALEHLDGEQAMQSAPAATPQPAPAKPVTPESAAAETAPTYPEPLPAQADKAAEKARQREAKQADKQARQAEKEAAKQRAQAAKQAEKDREEAAKQAEKDRKEAAKQAEKDRKQAEKAAAEAAKQAEKDRKEAAKQAEKDRKQAEKQAKKDAKKQGKNGEEGDS